MNVQAQAVDVNQTVICDEPDLLRGGKFRSELDWVSADLPAASV